MIRAVTLACPTCGVSQVVEIDEMGAAPETWPCEGSTDCRNRACKSCRVKCDGCGQWCCSDCIVDFSGELTCRICLWIAEEEAEELLVEDSYV